MYACAKINLASGAHALPGFQRTGKCWKKTQPVEAGAGIDLAPGSDIAVRRDLAQRQYGCAAQQH